MSNYRTMYGRPSWTHVDELTPRQYRRGRRKTERDFLAGHEPPRHPNRGKGTSGNPARRAGGHYETSGWAGPPGECGAECVCGVTYDGFDTVAEAGELLDRHIAESRPAQPRQPLRGSFSRYRAVRHDRSAVLRPGQPAWARRFDLVERAS